MADELTSAFLASEPSTQGVEQAQISSEAPQQSEPVAGSTQTPEKKPVNLYELPEFKSYQAQVTKTMTQLQQQLQQFEASRHEQAMAGMDDLERRDYLLNLKERELEAYRVQAQQAQIAQQRMQDIQKLSTMSGAPTTIFEAAETYDDAVRLAMEYMRTNGTAAQQAQAERAAANRVDLGGGKPPTPQEQRERTMADLLKKGDTRSYFKMMLEE